MSTTKKSKASGVNAASFFDLKAEIAARESEFKKQRASSSASTTVVHGGIKQPLATGKKPTVWAKSNKGVMSRHERDMAELEAIARPTVDRAMAALERKAQIYDKLKKGQTGGLNDKQYDMLLVDFDRKAMEEGGGSGSGSESESDEDESLIVPKPLLDDDPMVEYEDEFGRMRTARRSEVPRHLVNRPEEETPEDGFDPHVLRGQETLHHFPIYEPSAERVAEIAESAKETNPATHYDATYENRARAAGFYQFSGDEEARGRQLEELRRVREETERRRAEEGVDEEIGPQPAGAAEAKQAKEKEEKAPVLSKAAEKRKRELEERRRAIDAKRRKVLGDEEVERRNEAAKTKAADDLLAEIERDIFSKEKVKELPKSEP
ncbi:hypothetical protein CALVIDRAFT_533656 [Calocera viscosa TUFC12733]|uniref:Uncharacterized protein n=1 Tax=Calocera viscosa (strain TUFC12733) TaxID=1330018 RepID=A0A167R7Q0_CALVF|nr:hypothetical protein CALVIDRAFT_533656 [Calocera viscosa TUFC12733]